MKSIDLRKGVLFLAVLCLSVTLAGCGGKPIFGSNLEKGDALYNQGKYQEAMKYYTAAAEQYNASLGKTYTNLADAKKDAMHVVEAYFKSGLTADKLGDSASRALFEKALKDTYTVTEQYYVTELVHVPAGYESRYVSGYYKDVYVDGHYEDRYVDGGYKEVYVDGYYRADGTYVDGYYRKQQLDGHYEKVWVDGKYEQKYIDGHYEQVWVPAHDENKQIARTRQSTIKIDSTYIVQAQSKLGSPVSNVAPAPAAPTGDNAAVKAAYDQMTAAYSKWSDGGSPASGPLFDNMTSTKAAYQKLVR